MNTLSSLSTRNKWIRWIKLSTFLWKSTKKSGAPSSCLIPQRWSGGMRLEGGTGRRMILKRMCMYLKSKLQTLLGLWAFRKYIQMNKDWPNTPGSFSKERPQYDSHISAMLYHSRYTQLNLSQPNFSCLILSQPWHKDIPSILTSSFTPSMSLNFRRQNSPAEGRNVFLYSSKYSLHIHTRITVNRSPRCATWWHTHLTNPRNVFQISLSVACQPIYNGGSACRVSIPI